MTVKQLKEKLNGVPDDMDVYIMQTNDEFSLSLTEDAKIIEASFSEDSGPVLAKDNVFIITDEF